MAQRRMREEEEARRQRHLDQQRRHPVLWNKEAPPNAILGSYAREARRPLKRGGNAGIARWIIRGCLALNRTLNPPNLCL